MEVDNRKRGLWLATAGAALQAGFLIPYKLAVGQAPNEHAVVSLLFFAALFNSLATAAGVARARHRGVPGRVPDDERWPLTLAVIAGLSMFSILGNAAVGKAVAEVNPAVTAVLLQTQVLFVVLVGRFALDERFGVRFALGAVVAIGGVALMRQGGGELRMSASGLAWALTAAGSFGMMQVITRKTIRRIRPVAVNAARLWVSVIALALLPGRLEGALAMPTAVIALTALAAFAGPFIARVCLLYSAHHIPAALTSLVGMTSPVFTLALGVAVLGAWPTGVELLGGFVVLVGMALSLSERSG